MKKNILIKSYLLFVMSLNTAQAYDSYGNAQIARSDFSIEESGSPNYDKGVSIVLSAGMGLDKKIGVKGFSVEGELTKSITSPGLSKTETVAGASVTSGIEFSYWSAGVYGAYSFPITNSIVVKGRAGYVQTNITTKNSLTCSSSPSTCDNPLISNIFGTISENNTGKGTSYGISVSYSFADDKHYFLEYTKTKAIEDEGIEVSIKHIGAGISIGF
ncbi:MAG TPA: hypothetical protein ENJ28_02255 [Gammaproteobacteria bacterium]|nr:hypothetical protein [Gammaproteobacteria bacterium]